MTTPTARHECGPLHSTRSKSADPGAAVPHMLHLARPSGVSSTLRASPSSVASLLAPATAITSQRYQSAPASDSSTVGVNHTARSMLSRC